ncbi:hypothetical protein AAKU55_005799 [Oxalobacteraceae bacterium GrIS 1.11]
MSSILNANYPQDAIPGSLKTPFGTEHIASVSAEPQPPSVDVSANRSALEQADARKAARRPDKFTLIFFWSSIASLVGVSLFLWLR